jgi:hypothetical protein
MAGRVLKVDWSADVLSFLLFSRAARVNAFFSRVLLTYLEPPHPIGDVCQVSEFLIFLIKMTIFGLLNPNRHLSLFSHANNASNLHN